MGGPAAGEAHELEAIESAPRFARLMQDSSPPLAPLDYRLELMTDSGPASVPYGVLMLVAFDVPADRAAEADAWYEQEHIGLLMRADGWLRARRFRVAEHRGKSWTSLAFHEAAGRPRSSTPRRRRIARSTPWRAELAKESWFQEAGRWLFRRI